MSKGFCYFFFIILFCFPLLLYLCSGNVMKCMAEGLHLTRVD